MTAAGAPSVPAGAAQTAANAAVWAALGTVHDPELDEPLTDLGFVSHCTLSPRGEAVVRLRLPTYFCAPNFAFLMVADSYDAISAVPAVTAIDVKLEDHFASDVINAGVAARSGFVESFDGEAADELDGLRADFLRKALLAGTDRVCRSMIAAGTDRDRLAELTLGDAPEGPERERLRSRRAELGLPSKDGDALVIDALTGAPVESTNLRTHLGIARTTRVSQEANSGVCRGMLLGRYPERGQENTP